MIAFTKAQRKQAKLRLALAGPAGSGKTHSALLIAKGIGGRIAVIDTERGSASLYSDLVDFDTLELGAPFSPEKFIEALHAAEKAGYSVVVIDSITHEWDGSGGCLEINETLAGTKFKGNTWAAWNETTPRHRAFIDAVLQANVHVIATMRSKTETVQTDGGKVKKLGMKSVQREGTDYEFTVVLELDHDKHLAFATKDRTRLFKEPHLITEETGRRLMQWLASGADLAPIEPTNVSPHPVATAATLVQAAPIIVELRDLVEQKAEGWELDLSSRWQQIKHDHELGSAVWNGLKAYEAEFRAIKGVLKGTKEKHT